MKVYLINIEVQVYDEPISEMSDKEFMSYAIEQGTVYSLEEFEEEFNNPESNLSTEYDVIRFI